MTLNPGTLSVIFGLLFIAIALTGLIIFALTIRNKNTDLARLDKFIEIWKWTLGVFVIAVSTSIVSDTFKQREQDRNEMTAFNQYITIVTDSGTVDKKKRLCEFFIAVSPEGNMRKAWARYDMVLNEGKQKVSNLNKEEKELTTTIAMQGKEATTTQISSLNKIQEKKAEILLDLNATEKGGYINIAGADKTLVEAKFELEKAKTIGLNVAIYKKQNMYLTVFSGFKNRKEAQNNMSMIQATFRRSAYILSGANWCTVYQTTPDCIICKDNNRK